MKYSKLTLKEYADQFTDPFMQKAFATIQYDVPEVPTVIALIFLATLNKGYGGWPIGGSMALSKNIEQRYLELRPIALPFKSQKNNHQRRHCYRSAA